VILGEYEEIWAADFEFRAPAGERPDPLCVVARELRSGRVVRQWRSEFAALPPYRTDRKVLFVAYYASAELGCHLALDWQMPANVLDFYAEFRNATNGLSVPAGHGLLGALTYFGLDHIAATDKSAARELILRGGPWDASERKHILAYCESDVDALARLLERMAVGIDLPRALFRGRYMAAAAHIERNGVPIDIDTLERLRDRWDDIKGALIADIDRAFGVYENGIFKLKFFEEFLARESIAWPRLPSRQVDLADDTFRELSRSVPRVAPLRELRSSLSQMRLAALSVGSEGRNRALLSAFSSSTGRNQPSNSKFIFGPSVWLRGLIKPEPGAAIAYIDWASQEFGIAAVLSGDGRMTQAYASGDPYLAFAKQCGAVPPDATKHTHKETRDIFKTVVLGVGYGMEADALASRLAILPLEARELLRKHRETYPQFWRWTQNVVDASMLGSDARTVFGWNLCTKGDANPRSIRNFPMQANGAEMLRIACCLGTERGVRICAPVHDAILIEAPAGEIEHVAAKMQDYMRAASRIVLDGFELRTDAEITRYPDRYSDPRGVVMWDRVTRLIATERRKAHEVAIG
jgi:DNA polymerase family A